eukprot:scaffold4820_cov67-Phaeocystis_antarctica.AAC.3
MFTHHASSPVLIAKHTAPRTGRTTRRPCCSVSSSPRDYLRASSRGGEERVKGSASRPRSVGLFIASQVSPGRYS